MSYSLLANTGAASGNGSDVTTSAIDTTGANLIVVECATFGGGGTVSDSKSNTWTALNSVAVTGGRSGQLFYCFGPTVGSGHTFTVTGGFPAICVAAFSGAATSPVDGDVANQNANAGSITPSEDNELLVAGLCHSDTSAESLGSGFTITDDVANGGVNVGASMAYLIQTSATTESPTWSPGGNGRASLASFKAGAGGGGGSTAHNLSSLGVGA